MLAETKQGTAGTMSESWMLALIIAATSVGSAWVALLLISLRYERSRAPGLANFGHPTLEQAIFLFDNELLLDATQSARALLDATPAGDNDWARLSAFLAPRFEGFATALAGLAEAGRVELSARPRPEGEAALRLIAEDVSGLARLTLIDPEAEGRGVLVDGLSQSALEDELGQLRAVADHAPVLAWREDAAAAVIWANRAYMLRADALESEDGALVWPLPRLFETPASAGGPRRLCLGASGEKPGWYDVHRFALGDDALCFAVPADSAVRAERALRDFVQTLTKTFADLPIGLAIFDRQRQLQLFNPALIDLTQLGAEFLSARPTLYALLDRLREARMMPEPKDYRSWRQRMTALEQAAAAGHHVETWSLPGGQTYRVTGRPHPDGAVAFLFEDISSEVSLTRRFRADLELGQTVLDAMHEAVAVFLPSGDLATSNAAYARLWGVDPAATLGRVTLLDSVRVWQARAKTSAIWAEVREFGSRIDARAEWSKEVRLEDGQRLVCRFAPLPAGAMLAGFTPLAVEAATRRPPKAGPSLLRGAEIPTLQGHA